MTSSCRAARGVSWELVVDVAFGLWVGVDRGIGITLRVGWWRCVAGLVDGDRVMLVCGAVSMALGARPRVVLGRGSGFRFRSSGWRGGQGGLTSGVAISLSCVK